MNRQLINTQQLASVPNLRTVVPDEPEKGGRGLAGYDRVVCPRGLRRRVVCVAKLIDVKSAIPDQLR